MIFNRHLFHGCFWVLVHFVMRLFHLSMIDAIIWLARHPWLWR